MTKFKTRNDIPERNREQLATLLQQQLANAIDLGLQCKQAHWNVKGPTFIALHELFDTIAEATENYTDIIAERIVQFGEVALGTSQIVTKSTELPHYPLDAISGRQHLEALAHSLASFGEAVREAIETSEKHGDKGTADIFTEISRGVDKNLWFVEAHIQSE